MSLPQSTYPAKWVVAELPWSRAPRVTFAQRTDKERYVINVIGSASWEASMLPIKATSPPQKKNRITPPVLCKQITTMFNFLFGSV